MQRILLADDSATARLFTRKCLEIAGLRDATFLEVKNGKEALDLLLAEPVDLLVTDLTMPVMTGTDLLKEIRNYVHLMKLPIMVITSTYNQAKEHELTGLGATAVLGKPVNPTKVLAALKKIAQLKG